MRGDKGRSKPSPQLAMLLPIQGGVKIVEGQGQIAADEEEVLRQLVLSQLSKAGLRTRSRPTSETENPVTK